MTARLFNIAETHIPGFFEQWEITHRIHSKKGPHPFERDPFQEL